jgi:hypothetical protein
METSTWFIVIGLVLFILPVPPFGVTVGSVLIAVGLAMKWFG